MSNASAIGAGSFDPAPIDARLDAAEPSMQAYRDALVLGNEAIDRQFDAGVPALELLHNQTALFDLILQRLWRAAGSGFEALALMAVGGYGRRELHPCSDIDICILLPGDGYLEPALEERLSGWITSLWDLQRDIGSSVRSIGDCTREAAADITVITNLMEARLICGDASLFETLQDAVSPRHMWPSADFFAAKLDEQLVRRRKFHTNAYRLEPNVKESQGGLRDIQTISWVCQREFGTHNITDLVARGLLDAKEDVILRDGLELLWRIRYLLHRLSKRREDRLLFDYQREIAHAFGHVEDEGNRSIEQLMQRYYRTVMELQRLNEILLQGIGGIISGITAKADVMPIDRRFQLRNGYLEVTHRDVFMHYPPALLEIFVVFADTPAAENVRANTVRLIRLHLPLINDRFRSDPQVRRLFLQIFTNPNKLTRKIRMMNRYGVLAAYLPAFDAIVGRMQYDLFHIYTVDEHTIRVMRNLRRMALPQLADELSQCSMIMERVDKPELLYIAALFHDIAKGRGGDHSELGARDAESFCRQHTMDESQTALITWVVRNHLRMSITAQRKDITDPDIQHEFAQAVGTLERLNHLYLMTVADIRATNPELWNSFKASLLHSLYRSTANLLQRGLDKPVNRDELVAQQQAEAAELLRDAGLDGTRVTALWNGFGRWYFQQYEPPEIARHTQLIIANEDTPGPLVSLRHSETRGSLEILVYTPDDDALFALIATVLGQLHLNVLSATINTTTMAYALDTYHVLEADGSLVKGSFRLNEIRMRLQQELGEPEHIPTHANRAPSRRLKHFSIPTQVTFMDDDSNGFTELRIDAADQPGVLSMIGRTLLQAGISVHAARIATLGERIDDVFFIRGPDDKPLRDVAARESLSELLRENL